MFHYSGLPLFLKSVKNRLITSKTPKFTVHSLEIQKAKGFLLLVLLVFLLYFLFVLASFHLHFSIGLSKAIFFFQKSLCFTIVIKFVTGRLVLNVTTDNSQS